MTSVVVEMSATSSVVPSSGPVPAHSVALMSDFDVPSEFSNCIGVPHSVAMASLIAGPGDTIFELDGVWRSAMV